jgi:hypothetical protein
MSNGALTSVLTFSQYCLFTLLVHFRSLNGGRVQVELNSSPHGIIVALDFSLSREHFSLVVLSRISFLEATSGVMSSFPSVQN